MRWIHPRNASFALKIRWLAQVWMCEARKGESRRVVQMVCDCLFWGVGACMSTVALGCFSTNATWQCRIWGQHPVFWVSHLTPVVKGTAFQELVLPRDQRGALLPWLLLHSSPCPFLSSVKGKQDCSSACAVRKTHRTLYQSWNKTERTFLAHCHFYCSFEHR